MSKYLLSAIALLILTACSPTQLRTDVTVAEEVIDTAEKAYDEYYNGYVVKPLQDPNNNVAKPVVKRTTTTKTLTPVKGHRQMLINKYSN